MSELKQLANEMRQLVLEKDAAISGHVGPNLGAMEAMIAFHYVFDSHKDKIIWDISHLAYGHKMLTGRKEALAVPPNTRIIGPRYRRKFIKELILKLFDFN